jgi:hypothetical protein
VSTVSRETKNSTTGRGTTTRPEPIIVQLFTATWHPLNKFEVSRDPPRPPTVIVYDHSVYVLRDRDTRRVYRYQAVPFVFLTDDDEMQTLSPVN